MKSFSTSTIVHASPENIWNILTNASDWSNWNPTVIRVEGKIALGEKITLYAKVNPNRAFPLTVTEFVPSERMVWSGGMPLGLFKGERTYTLNQKPDGSVEFSMQEIFSGLMAPLIAGSIPDLKPSFDEFASALKRRVEEGI
jgi:hypothetical protein